MTTNVHFEYLYRDGANYKAWGMIVFSNPDHLSVAEIDSRLSQAFNPDSLFVAGQIQVPEIFLYSNGKVTSDDHCYHEYDHVELTDALTDDIQSRTISDFLTQVEIASERGWEAFDPHAWIILRNVLRSDNHVH
ncbi:MAG: hypothetical protein HY870_12520 [Chloroflexi bacterium]|nr:hypothetical protein [Chloroflexota bacterium]